MSSTLTALQTAKTRLSDMARRHANARHTLEREQDHEKWPLQQEIAALQAQYDRECSEAASDPDEGRRVFRDEPLYRSNWSSKPYGTKRLTGVVEVWRVGSATAGRSTPGIGQVVVRLHKAGGTPGAKWEYMSTGWQFEDGQPSKAPPEKELEL